MLIPTHAVHAAALAIKVKGDVNQSVFEDVYHCKIGLSPDLVNFYYVQFLTDKAASMFLLRWL